MQVAPTTAAHILKLVKLGGYNGNHFFRVDKGFVAQTASVVGGRSAKLDIKQQVCCSSAGAMARNLEHKTLYTTCQLEF